MSATISKTFTSPDFLTKFLEEYREMQSHLTLSTFISDYGYTSGAWMSSDTPSPASTYSNPTPSATPVNSPELGQGTLFAPY